MSGTIMQETRTSFIPAGAIALQVALLLLLFVVAAGATVGAAHGLVLIWLLRSRRSMTTA